MKTADFDWKKAGYDGVGDWPRLWDLLPAKAADDSKDQKITRANYEAGSQKKSLLLLLLLSYDITPEAYDPEAARTRNVA